jgi:hypothetical protein
MRKYREKKKEEEKEPAMQHIETRLQKVKKREKCQLLKKTYRYNINESGRFGALKSDLEMPVPSQGHCGFHSFPVVD